MKGKNEKRLNIHIGLIGKLNDRLCDLEAEVIKLKCRVAELEQQPSGSGFYPLYPYPVYPAPWPVVTYTCDASTATVTNTKAQGA